MQSGERQAAWRMGRGSSDREDDGCRTTGGSLVKKYWHQMADRPDGDGLPGGRQVARKAKLTRKAPSDKEGVKQRGEYRSGQEAAVWPPGSCKSSDTLEH